MAELIGDSTGSSLACASPLDDKDVLKRKGDFRRMTAMFGYEGDRMKPDVKIQREQPGRTNATSSAVTDPV